MFYAQKKSKSHKLHRLNGIGNQKKKNQNTKQENEKICRLFLI